jgi:hypothetical protein
MVRRNISDTPLEVKRKVYMYVCMLSSIERGDRKVNFMVTFGTAAPTPYLSQAYLLTHRPLRYRTTKRTLRLSKKKMSLIFKNDVRFLQGVSLSGSLSRIC